MAIVVYKKQRTKFIKIEEKKKVNIVKNRNFKYRNFFLYGNFKNYCKENLGNDKNIFYIFFKLKYKRGEIKNIPKKNFRIYISSKNII